MAKSIRSKAKRANRAVLREKIHKPVELSRLERLVSNEQKESQEQQKTVELEITNVPTSEPKLTRAEKERLFLSRNQYKKRINARAKSAVRVGKK